MKEKERRKVRGEGKEAKKIKAMVALLVFIIATFSAFGRKELFDAKGPFGDNVIKNPARSTCQCFTQDINHWNIETEK